MCGNQKKSLEGYETILSEDEIFFRIWQIIGLIAYKIFDQYCNLTTLLTFFLEKGHFRLI